MVQDGSLSRRRLEKPGVYCFCAENACYAVDSSVVGLVAEVLVWDDWPRFWAFL